VAFDFTTTTKQRTPLMEIDLGATTLRYADQHLSLSDGTHYEGRIISFPSVQLSLGRLLNAEFRRPSITVTLSDPDREISTLFLANNEFVGKPVTLKIVSGTNAADVKTCFVGCRKFPGGVSWDDGRFSMAIEWDLKADMRPLPRQKFFPSAYPRVEDKSKFLPIPWIYGDFRSTVTENQKVPCYQIDYNEGTGGRFKIAETLQAIEAVYKNGVSVAFTASAGDITAGEFVLDVAYDPLLDTIEAHVLGATTATFSGAGAEFSLPRLAYDLLTNSSLLDLAASRINVTAFADWEGELSANTLGRRWIGTETAGGTLLAEIFSDGLADNYLNTSNEYTPIYRKRDTQSGIPTYREADLKPLGRQGRAFSVQVDEQTTYANVVVGDYARRPESGESYAASVTDEGTSAISAAGSRHRRRLRMGWLYTAAAAEPRTAIELTIFSREVQTTRITLGPPGLALNPTDQFKLAYGPYELADGGGTVFQVRDIQYNFRDMEATVTAWNLDPLTSGTYTNDAAPNWASASASQRVSQGFWTNDSGEADPGDSASTDSKFF